MAYFASPFLWPLLGINLNVLKVTKLPHNGLIFDNQSINIMQSTINSVYTY